MPGEAGAPSFDPEHYRAVRGAALLGPAGHRLLNLLMTIVGNTTLVARALDPAGREARLLGASERAALEASRLVGQLHGVLDEADVAGPDLGVTLRELAPLLGAIGAGRLRVEASVPDGFPVERGGALLRLLVLHATAEVVMAADGRDGVLRLDASEAPGGRVRLDFVYAPADDGPRLDPGRFLQVLAGPAAALGGRVAPGDPVGVILPASTGASAEAVAPFAPGDAAESLAVLLVDDEAPLLDAMRRMLGQQGFRVLTAGDGRQALDVIEAERVDLVVVDLMMPGMDGGATIAAVRARRPGLPVVLSTGLGAAEARARYRGPAVDGILCKPWGARDLRGVIASARKPPADS